MLCIRWLYNILDFKIAVWFDTSDSHSRPYHPARVRDRLCAPLEPRRYIFECDLFHPEPLQQHAREDSVWIWRRHNLHGRLGTKLSLGLYVHSIDTCPLEYLYTITYCQLSYCLFNICWHLRPTLLRRERGMCPIPFNQHIRLRSVSGIQLRNSMRPSSQFHPFEHKCIYCISFCAQIDSTWISNVDTHPSITSNITSIRAFKYNEFSKYCAFTWHCYKQFVRLQWIINRSASIRLTTI